MKAITAQMHLSTDKMYYALNGTCSVTISYLWDLRGLQLSIFE